MAERQKIMQEREKRYIEIVNKYDDHERKFLSMMFTELVWELESNCNGKMTRMVDVLGELYSSFDFRNRWKGQFFTHQHLCDLIGQITLFENSLVEKHIKKYGFFTANEPCCGGGAMIYGVVNAMCGLGYNPNKNILIFAGDIETLRRGITNV